MDSQAPELLPPTGTEVVEFSQTEAGLAELRSQLAGATFDCSTTAGDKEARASRFALVKLRSALEDKRKELKAPLVERGRLIDAEAKRITGEILALEQPIDAVIRAAEAEREQRRIERERAEAARLTAINAAIDNIKALPVVYVAGTQDVLRDAMAALGGRDLSAEFDAVHLPRAEEARAAALFQLDTLLSQRVAADAEAARLQAEREALEQQRREAAAEQARIEAEAAAARAEADRLARAQREREAAAARQEQERIAAEQRAESERLAAERAELERQQAEQRQKEAAAQAQREREAAEARAREEAEAIERATLISAANDACNLLHELGQGQHLVTRTLSAALLREGVLV